MLQTWRRTETPPVPIKKDVTIKFQKRDEPGMLEINLIPVVISKIPKIEYSIQLFLNKDNILVDWIIEIIIEKIITKPHTTLNVLKAFFMQSLNIPPRDEKESWELSTAEESER